LSVNLLLFNYDSVEKSTLINNITFKFEATIHFSSDKKHRYSLTSVSLQQSYSVT